jgi:hypothetical protein
MDPEGFDLAALERLTPDEVVELDDFIMRDELLSSIADSDINEVRRIIREREGAVTPIVFK